MPNQVAATTAENTAPANPTADEVLAGHDLSGKRIIVTGASSGVGSAIAAALAGRGAEVTMAVRDVVAGERVAAEIAAARGVAMPKVRHVDLLSMASVRAFAAGWGDGPLDVLINNAGLMGTPLTVTADGFESQMAVNFFAPFLLSELLLPNLAQAAPARVVTVSSGSHHLARLRLDDLNYRERAYDKYEAYGHAKFCANLLAVEYSRRHGAAGVTMNVVTPGGVATNLGRQSNFEDAIRLGWVNSDGSLPRGRMRSLDEGAASPVWAAVAPELSGRGGLYLEDCAIAPMWAPPVPPGWDVTRESLDPQAARELWDVAAPLLEETRP